MTVYGSGLVFEDDLRESKTYRRSMRSPYLSRFVAYNSGYEDGNREEDGNENLRIHQLICATLVKSQITQRAYW